MKQGKISDYVNPVPIKITDDKAIFKVEKLVPSPYIERVLPLEYAPLYEQLAELDTAIPKIVCLEKSDRLTVIEEYIDSPRLDQYLETHKLTSAQIHDLICQLLDVLAPARAAALGAGAAPEALDRAFLDELTALNDLFHREYGVPLTLSELGVSRDDLPAVAKQARYDGAALYNETEITLEDALAILEAAY